MPAWWWYATAKSTTFASCAASWRRSGTRFATGSDSEVLLHGYAQWGDEFVQRLNGMFGFALWDARRRRLLIGRDRLGIKPLYLYRDAKRLAFASEAKALLALPGVQAAIEPVGPASLPEPRLRARARIRFSRASRKLAPATLLTVERGRIEQSALLAHPGRPSSAKWPKASGSSGCAPVSTSRYACRW